MYFHTTAYPDIDCTIFPIRWTGTAHFGRTSSRFFLAAEISSHDILFFQTSALIADFADFHFSLYSVSNVGFRGKSGLSFDSNISLRSFKLCRLFGCSFICTVGNSITLRHDIDGEARRALP